MFPVLQRPPVDLIARRDADRILLQIADMLAPPTLDSLLVVHIDPLVLTRSLPLVSPFGFRVRGIYPERPCTPVFVEVFAPSWRLLLLERVADVEGEIRQPVARHRVERRGRIARQHEVRFAGADARFPDEPGHRRGDHARPGNQPAEGEEVTSFHDAKDEERDLKLERGLCVIGGKAAGGMTESCG